MSHWPAPLQGLLRVIGASYVAYLLLAFIVVLPLLNVAAPWAVQRFLHRKLSQELILFNPFTFALVLRGADIREADGHEPLSVRLLRVDLSLSSLWTPGVVFDALRVDGLEVHALRHGDGRWHFSDLVASGDGGPADAPQAPTPRISVQRLDIDAATLRFTDRSRPGGYTAAYHDVSLDAADISTRPGREGPAQLSLRAGSGGTASWDGLLRPGDGELRGTLSLDHFDLTHLWAYAEEGQPYALQSAALDLALPLRLQWLEAPGLNIDAGSLRLHEVRMLPRDTAALPDTQLALGELRLERVDIDSRARRAALDSAALRDVTVSGFDRGGEISLLRMLLPPAADGAPASAAPADETPETADAGSAAPTWEVAVGALTLDDSRIDWHSDRLSPSKLRIAPLSLRGEALQWPGTESSALRLELALNEATQFVLSGDVNLSDLSGALDFSLSTLPVSLFNPLLDSALSADIDSGVISLDGALSLVEAQPTALDGAVTLEDLRLRIHGFEESFFGVDALRLTDLHGGFPDRRLLVGAVEIERPRGTLRIREDGSLNVSHALVTPSEPQAADPEPAGPPGESPAPWSFRIDALTLRDGQLDFADAALPLPFSALIADISADIEDLDSASGEPLTALLEGAVDGYAPVRIEASGRPLATDRTGTLTLDFSGLDIATMTPYSGTYVGYAIDSGSLSATLNYRLDGQRLAGNNRFVISQMRLGESIESDRALAIPLKLGLALLTDSRGIIDLDVPISGDVDDPQFEVGRVIGRAIANLITKAATAPFRLLAGLVGSDRDLETIAFAAGSADLDAAGRDTLSALAQALGQRPGLRLGVAGGGDLQADVQELRQQRLEAELLDGGLSAQSIGTQDLAYQAAIAERYRDLALPIPEDATPPDTQTQLEALRERITLPATALRDLGIDRATAVKRELVNAGAVDASRIAVSYDADLGSALVRMSVSS